MTAQIPDILIHRGRKLDLCACPLEHYLSRLPKARRPRFRWPSTALWRGYVATWEIVGRRLYLVELDGAVETEAGVEQVDLAAAIPWRRGPIPATWVTDVLRCPEGRLRTYVHAMFASVYERDRKFLVTRGAIEEELLVCNPPQPLVYAIDPDGGRAYLQDGMRHREHAAEDPFPADAPIEPWRLWGHPDWGLEETEGWFLGGFFARGTGSAADP